MKKVILSIFTLGLLFVACEKEIVTPTSELSQNGLNVQDESSESVNVKANGRVWHDNGAQPGVDGQDYGCWNSGGNCLAEVVVVGLADINDMGDITDVVDTGISEDIIDSFDDNERMLDNYINSDIVDGVISGDIIVTGRGALSSTYYFVFNEQGKIVNVTPMSK